MPGQLMSAKEISALAALPSREELIAKLLGTMQAPIVKFVRTLNEVPSRFVRTLAAVRDAKPAAEAGANANTDTIINRLQTLESGVNHGCCTS